MSDENNGRKNRSLLDEIQQMRLDADKGREPKMLESRMGTRQYSLAALIERIVVAFMDEHAGGSAALLAAETETERLKLILATVDYVIAVESILITAAEKADVMRHVYAELFTYGPLDALFADETITTISIEGAEKVAVRYGHGELVALEPIFEDEGHVRKIIKRLLLDSGADLSPEIPIIEAGLRVNQRPVSVSVAGPPVTIEISADIRLHPAQAVTLADMVRAGWLSTQAGELLAALAASPHGVVIVGDTESGKTTLLGALAGLLPGAAMVAVERAGELHLPEGAERLVVEWGTQDREGRSFGDQIGRGLTLPRWVMVLDEVRADEAEAISQLLAATDVPRQLWAFRGPSDSKRLASALGMLARRSMQSGGSEALVHTLYQRLPFVVTLRRRKNAIQLHSISEWQFPEGAEYPDYVELMAMGWEAIELTGKRPAHPLDLPDDFWGV